VKAEAEIILPQGWRGRLAKALLALLLSLGLLALGYHVSPPGESGLPRLLTPRLARLEQYRQSVQGWAGRLAEAQVQMAALLEETFPAGLFAQNEQVEQAYGSIWQVAQEIERSRVPASMESLHAQAQSAADAALSAAESLSAWVGEPGEANYTAAQQALAAAEAALAQLSASPWLAQEGGGE